ncbi:MAG: hypothetical protein IPP15_08805 [Saprospiraceae bacterium]|uniref:Uncharacterized protein n=1 Tax=Candidatus Opimibacter skivensis TaxID=2982028 RepID=A0A9D7XNS7_9BACT|nr:hypothetical protein [Candidatus Opimibacter skivensis]
MKLIQNTELYKYLMWVYNEGRYFREIENVIQLHYYLHGYYSAEANVKLDIQCREGYWIHEFMFFCERQLNIEINNSKEEWVITIGSNYANYIYANQLSPHDGLLKVFGYLELFISTNYLKEFVND